MLKPMNKVINRCYIKQVYLLFFSICFSNAYAQDTALNKYGLLVINDMNYYQASVKKDFTKEMVDLKKLLPDLVLDLKYAGKNNFTKMKLYPPVHTSYLRKTVAMALAAVQLELKTRGLGLKIFDAYRPYSVTEKMWELVQDERYAANPKNGSGHNRGIAVDLTIIDLISKHSLNMGTEFDNFTDTAHHTFRNLPNEILQNRIMLRNIMEKNGFKALDTEWWHYSFSNGGTYELLNVPFNELRKRKK